ncbi:MAG: hypothetical protein J6Y94_04885, partial [Bacteriovoracaceae bacterium]|nr:hypothetical protein [Bacteriovoracaceae bacterium]
ILENGDPVPMADFSDEKFLIHANDFRKFLIKAKDKFTAQDIEKLAHTKSMVIKLKIMGNRHQGNTTFKIGPDGETIVVSTTTYATGFTEKVLLKDIFRSIKINSAGKLEKK